VKFVPVCGRASPEFYREIQMGASRQSVSQRIERGIETPSVPLVLTRIIQILDDDNASSRELEQLILHDPSLTARILRLANSAFYSFRAEVKTISHAIMLLGLNLVKSLAIGINIFESFNRGMKSEVAQISKLWMHSFATALVVQEIWQRRGGRKEAEFAFLCGLLHDFGKALFFKADTAYYAHLFAQDKTEDDGGISALELEAYGMDHAAIGASLAKQWGLPPELSEVVRNHHRQTDSGSQLAAAVTIADTLVREAKIGYDGDTFSRIDRAALLEKLSMDSEEFENLVLFTEKSKKCVEDFFQTAL
jgi:putative nucleotidyltransferase with HDIG domain